MANKRVIELNERTQIDMNDWLLVDSSTSTRKLSIATLLSYFTYYSLIFVEELPTQDIQPNVVYLVPHSGSNTQWDEYIYINNDWSLIGVSTIDLSSIYQSKTDNNLQTTSKQIVGAINEVKSALSNKANTSYVEASKYGSEISLATGHTDFASAYIVSADGYVTLNCMSHGTDGACVKILASDAVNDGNPLAMFSVYAGTYSSQSVFVRKGMKVIAVQTGSTSTAQIKYVALKS